MKIRPDTTPPSALLVLCASNQATLLLLVLLGLSIVVYYQLAVAGRIWLLAIPSALLILNFLLALATRDILKNNGPLMMFHFALVALVILAFTGRMSSFTATLELAQNETFDGQLENVQQGPWHRYGLAVARFTNLGFQIRYQPGVKRDKTLNRVLLELQDGSRQELEIGDHVPLVIGHYRFYTSHNKGYAPVFEWRAPASKEIAVGSIHLPAYPAHEHGQALEWRVPGTDRQLWTMLRIDEDVLPQDREFHFRVPDRHRLIVRDGDARHELRPGDELELAGGKLVYRRLTTWMGYRVDYDWTRPWLLAAALIGLASLFVHYIIKFRRI
ncbi:MAG: hypothetical protein EP300_07305 [Gammaproteobacteria bacterium]|nr:MAG: hypothetical protein EP300_07305 [Gammaproteobacteria bacterium]